MIERIANWCREKTNYNILQHVLNVNEENSTITAILGQIQKSKTRRLDECQIVRRPYVSELEHGEKRGEILLLSVRNDHNALCP